MTGSDDDPRIDGEFVRRCRASSGECQDDGGGLEGGRVHADDDGRGVGDVVLVGVVHDHPASTYRVRQVVDAVDPDVLALELPPMAVGLFEQYAADERTPPAFGGEMSAAIQAAGTDRVAGVDGPSPGFLGRLASRLVAERPSTTLLRRVGRSLASVTRHALVCRLAAAVAAHTGLRVEVTDPVAHDADRGDHPTEQAADERAQVRQCRTFVRAFAAAPASRAARLRDEVRNDHMAARLAALRREGTVVAVVGYDHLDALVERLDGSVE